MTALTRAKTVLNSLTDKNLSGPKAGRIIDRYISHSIDTKDMTDEAKAEAFLENLTTLLKNHVMSSAIGEAQRNNKNAEDLAIANSKKDFD